MLPIIFNSPYFTLYSYPFCMGIAWGLAYALAPHYKRSSKNINLIFASLFVSAWIGAKILFLISLKSGELIGEQIVRTSFWLGGGFVFYGGVIGASIAVIILIKLQKIKLNEIISMLPLIPLGHAIGRIGCFLAGCCYGVESNSWIAVFMHGHYRLPVQLLESAALMIIFLVMHLLHKKNCDRYLLVTYLGSYSLVRFTLEFFRGDIARGIYGGISMSQIISIAIFLLCLGLVQRLRMKE